MAMNCLLSHYPSLNIPRQYIPVKPAKGWHFLSRHLETKIPLAYNKKLHGDRNGVGHAIGKWMFLPFHYYFLRQHPQFLILLIFPFPKIFLSKICAGLCVHLLQNACILLSATGWSKSCNYKPTGNMLTHSACAEINVPKLRQWSGKIAEMPLAMQWQKAAFTQLKCHLWANFWVLSQNEKCAVH